MKIMFAVYHDIRIEARSQEILECAKKLGETVLVSYSKPFEDNDCKCILTGNGKRNYLAFLMATIKAIKTEKPNVVILHDNYTAIILAWLKKYRKETYVIYDSSELYIEKIRSNSIKIKIADFMMRKFEKKYLKYANVVIAANIERANIMKEYFELNDLPIVFDNVHRIDDDYNTIECNKKYAKLFKEDVFCIVYGGGIARQRLTFELAEAVGSLGDNYRLIVVGRANDTDKNQFYSMLEERNFSNVFYAGFIPRNEWRYMLNKAGISVSVFAQDTVNNINCASGKLYESFFEGTPALTSQNPPLKRICTEHNIGVSTNNFKNGIVELEKKHDYYCKNVKAYIKTLDVDGRIDNLAMRLRKKMEADKFGI